MAGIKSRPILFLLFKRSPDKLFYKSMRKECTTFGYGMSFFIEKQYLVRIVKEMQQGFAVEEKKWYDTSIWVYSMFFRV